MIGTNNSNNQDNTETEILEGVTAIVQQIRERQPDTKILLLAIFPRGKTFSPQRGKILQVNGGTGETRRRHPHFLPRLRFAVD
jgi:beta-glucosidase